MVLMWQVSSSEFVLQSLHLLSSFVPLHASNASLRIMVCERENMRLRHIIVTLRVSIVRIYPASSIVAFFKRYFEFENKSG